MFYITNQNSDISSKYVSFILRTLFATPKHIINLSRDSQNVSHNSEKVNYRTILSTTSSFYSISLEIRKNRELQKGQSFYISTFSFSIAITLTWVVTIVFCIPLIFSHSEMRTPNNYSYCDFSENKTIEFLPESWGWRWSNLAFKVSWIRFNGVVFIFESIVKLLILLQNVLIKVNIS